MAAEKTVQVEVRLPADVYAVVKLAAEMEGRSISDFAVSAAHDGAKRVSEDDRIVRLSAEDSVRFAETLLNPAEPNEALKRAMRSHAKKVEVRYWWCSFPR